MNGWINSLMMPFIEHSEDNFFLYCNLAYRHIEYAAFCKCKGKNSKCKLWGLYFWSGFIALEKLQGCIWANNSTL